MDMTHVQASLPKTAKFGGAILSEETASPEEVKQPLNTTTNYDTRTLNLRPDDIVGIDKIIKKVENLIDPIQDVEQELEYRILNSTKKEFNEIQDVFAAQEMLENKEDVKSPTVKITDDADQIKEEFNKNYLDL